MAMDRILVLGRDGMLGRAVRRVLAQQGFDVRAAARADLDAEADGPALSAALAAWMAGRGLVVNAIGVIKPYIRDDDPAEVERAVRVNALFPHALAAAAARAGAKVVQIATDCVYDGARGGYTERDPHNALDVYGKTKSLGEVPAAHVLHLRASIVGREGRHFRSLLEWFLRQPPGAAVNGYANHFWNGVTTDAFARLCAAVARRGADAWEGGVRHVLPADTASKADLLRLFARVFGRGDLRLADVDAPDRIDRTLATVDPGYNARLWRDAGYAEPPTLARLVEELA